MSSQKALSLTIRDDETLRSAYMPWLKHGGLFVPTEQTYAMGQQVYLLVALPGDEARVPVDGEVVWITPPGASHRMAGIGVHFGADDRRLRERIEARLGPSARGATSHTL